MAAEDTMANAMKNLADTAKQTGQNILDCIRKDAEKIAGKPTGKSFIPETTEIISSIKDSGDRTEFVTGAVRDMREGKGRCDLMPLLVAAEWLKDDILGCIAQFQRQGTTVFLYGALNYFTQRAFDDLDIKSFQANALLEVAKHFEEGAKKYGENNWQKGIPVHCYIDSAVRHYLKWLRGDNDEPHDRAFVWNIMCCIWEVDYHKEDKCDEEN
jgi:hypothetical protein